MWTIGIVGRKRERYVVLSGNILYSDDGLLNAYMSTIDFFSNVYIGVSLGVIVGRKRERYVVLSG